MDLLRMKHLPVYGTSQSVSVHPEPDGCKASDQHLLSIAPCLILEMPASSSPSSYIDSTSFILAGASLLLMGFRHYNFSNTLNIVSMLDADFLF